MISWTREGGGLDDNLEVCKQRCEDNANSSTLGC